MQTEKARGRLGPSGSILATIRQLPYCDLRFASFRDYSELLHQAQGVPADPAFHHLAAGESRNADAGDGDLLPGWRNSAQLAFVRASAVPTYRDSFAVGKEFLYR